MDGRRIPVLIVGAGVGGLATSALLAKHGIPSLLVEKRREVFIYPKARNLSFRTLEILRGLGLSDQVHAVADGVSSMVVKPTLNSARLPSACRSPCTASARRPHLKGPCSCAPTISSGGGRTCSP